jgi:transposase-like protein
MQIIAHLGTTIKACRERSRHWRPARCPGCGQEGLGWHGRYGHGGEPGDAQGLLIERFACGACRRSLSVLPDLLLPRASYPAPTRDRAVTTYVTGQATYAAIARELGVSQSTVWRWTHAATEAAAGWLEATRAGLRALGEPDGPVRFRPELRALFLRRRVRRPGMLEGLLLLQALLEWVQRLRAAMLAHRLGPLAAGLHAFGHHVLTRLSHLWRWPAGAVTQDGTSCPPGSG